MEGGEGHLGRGSSICMKEPVPEGGRLVGAACGGGGRGGWGGGGAIGGSRGRKGAWEQLIPGFVARLSFAPCSVSKGAQSGLDRLEAISRHEVAGALAQECAVGAGGHSRAMSQKPQG